MDNVVGPLSARLDGKFAEMPTFSDWQYLKYKEYLHLSRLVKYAEDDYKHQKQVEETLNSEYDEVCNRLNLMIKDKIELEVIPYDEYDYSRNRRISMLEYMIRSKIEEKEKLTREKKDHEYILNQVKEKIYKTKLNLDEYVLNLCR